MSNEILEVPTHITIHMQAVTEECKLAVGIFKTFGHVIPKPLNAMAGFIWTSGGYLSRKQFAALGEGVGEYLKPTLIHEEYLTPKEDDLNCSFLSAVVEVIKNLDSQPTPKNVTIFATNELFVRAISKLFKSDNELEKIKRLIPTNHTAKLLWELYELSQIENRDYDLKITTPLDSSNMVGINKAGFIAKMGTNLKPTRGVIVMHPSIDKIYWKGWTTKPPLMCLRYMLIHTDDFHPNYYTLMETGNDIYNCGKRAGKTCYGVVNLTKGKDNYVVKLVEDALGVVKHSTLMALDVDKVFNKHISSALNQYGKASYKTEDGINYHVKFIDGNVPLLTEVKPINMTLMGVDNGLLIRMVLEAWDTDNVDRLPYENIIMIDVTDQFYLDGKLKPSIRSNGSILKLELGKIGTDGNDSNIFTVLNLGRSVPSINAIGQLASKTTKVTLFAWKINGSNLYTYVLIWDTPNGSGAFGNLDTTTLYL